MYKEIPNEAWVYAMTIPEALSKTQINDFKDIYKNFDKEKFFLEAKKMKILPNVAHLLCYLDCDTENWTEVHNIYEIRNKKIVVFLNKLFTKLNNVGMNKVCLAENFGTLLSTNSCIGCFSSGDVDLYCDELNLDLLDNIMSEFGFVWSDRHTRVKSFAKEYKSTDVIGEEFWINFQWKPMTRKKTHLYDQRFILKRYKSSFDDVILYKNTSIRMFNPTMALYFNCIHISSGHYYILSPGIRLYADVDRLIRKCDIDWEKFNKMIDDDNIGIRSDVVLHLSKKFLLTDVPKNAYSENYSKVKTTKFINSLVTFNPLIFHFPKRKKIKFILFLVRVELQSDCTNVVRSLLRRFWVLLIDWN